MLHKKLKYLFPDIDEIKDYELTDIGSGQFISIWNRTEKQPSIARLIALNNDSTFDLFVVDQHRAFLHNRINKQAKHQIEVVAKLPPWKQRNADKGLYETGAIGFSVAVDSYIAGVISVSNNYQTSVYDVTNDTVSKLDVIPQPVWPSVPAILLT